jgi:hypothetical protein
VSIADHMDNGNRGSGGYTRYTNLLALLDIAVRFDSHADACAREHDKGVWVASVVDALLDVSYKPLHSHSHSRIYTSNPVDHV